MKRLLVVLVLLLAPAVVHADTRSDARRYFNRGMEAIQEGRTREGITLLLRAYELRPHPNVLFNIGRAYASIGDVNAAIESFNRYLESDPPDEARVRDLLAELEVRRRLRSLVDQGMTAIAEGRYLEGVALLERAYAERPHANLLFNIGRALEQAGDYDRAIASYEAYLRSSPPDAQEIERKIESLKSKTIARKPPEKVPPDKRSPPIVPIPPSRTETSDQEARRVAELILEYVRQGAKTGPPAAVAVTPEVTTSTSVALGAEVDVEAKAGAGYEEVVVTASRREQSPLDAPNAVTIISDEQIRLSGARTIPDLLRRVPGMDVMAMSYSDFNVSMRGFNRRVANKILVLIDGRTAYQDFLGGMLWRGLTIDLSDIARIEVVRGPGSAIYGAYAYTGIVNIITKRPEEIRRAMLSASAGNGKVFEGSGQYGERRGPIGVRVSGGFERGDKYELEFDPARVDYTTNVEEPERSLERVRFDAAAEYNLKSGGRLFAGGGVSSGEFELYGVSALRNQDVRGLGGNLRAGYTGDLFSLLTFWDFLRVRSTPQFYRTGLPDLGSKVRADTVSVEPVFRPTFNLLGEHNAVLGGEYRHKFVAWDYIDEPHDEDHFAVFAQDAWSITPWFTALASARLDKHPIIGFLGSPRIALIVKPGKGQAIRTSVGTAFRQPTQAENYLDLSAATPLAGAGITLIGGEVARKLDQTRPELAPENILTIDLGYLTQLDFGEIEVVGYLNRVSNLITRTPLIPSDVRDGFDMATGTFIVARSYYVNEDRVFLAPGFEIGTRLYPLEGLDIGASYAFQYIFDEQTGERFTDSPIHKASLWTSFRSSFGLDLGASIHFVSDQDWVEPTFDSAQPSGFRNIEDPHVPAAVVIIGRAALRLFEDKVELAVSGSNLADTGGNRHREHPFANRLEARVLGTMTVRF